MTSLLKDLLWVRFQWSSSSNTSLPYVSHTSVHQLNQVRLSLGEEGFLFSLTILSMHKQQIFLRCCFQRQTTTYSSPFRSLFQRGQCSSTEAPKDIFKVNFYLTPQAPVCNCSSSLPERRFLAALPFAKPTLQCKIQAMRWVMVAEGQ